MTNAWIDRLLDLGLEADAEVWKVHVALDLWPIQVGCGYGWRGGNGLGDGDSGYGSGEGGHVDDGYGYGYGDECGNGQALEDVWLCPPFA